MPNVTDGRSPFECINQAVELQQTCGEQKEEEQTPYSKLADAIMNTPSPRIVGPRIDLVPEQMLIEAVPVRYRLELTEAQIEYLHDLVATDEEGHSIEALTAREFDNVVDQLEWHHKGIHGPADR